MITWGLLDVHSEVLIGRGAYLLPATVRASPEVAVFKSNFVDETPNRMQTTIT